MATTEFDPTTPNIEPAELYWMLDGLRIQLYTAQDEFFSVWGYGEHDGLWSELANLPDDLHRVAETVEQIQSGLAAVIVKQAGPAAD